jgi:hypothetical protein
MKQEGIGVIKYYFNIRTGEDYIADHEGQEHPALHEAKEAMQARSILMNASRLLRLKAGVAPQHEGFGEGNSF